MTRTDDLEPEATASPPRFVRGWGVVAGVFLLLALASGLGFYNASVYLQAAVAERGISIAVASGASATFFVAAGLAGLPISRLLDARDPRVVILGGGVVGAAALLVLGAAQGALGLYVGFALFGVGFAAIAFVPGTTLVNRWFARRRTLALTLATTGLSVGGIVLTPASARAIETSGLDVVAPWLALVWFLGVTIVTLVAIRPSPDRYGFGPDGDAPVPLSREVVSTDVSPRDAYRTKTFRWLAVGLTLMLLTQVGTLSHLYPIGEQRVGAGTAALAVSVTAGASVVGRFLGLWVLRHLDALRFAIVLGATQVVALSMLAPELGAVGLLLAVALFGITVGNLLVLIPVVIVETFGTDSYPRIYASIQLVTTLGIATGPLVIGALRQALGTYAPGALAAAGVSLVAISLLSLAERARVREGLLATQRAEAAAAREPVTCP
jgi:MFS family permease